MASQVGYKPLQGHTAASLNRTEEVYRGRLAAVSIRKWGSEISALISGQAHLMIGHSCLVCVNPKGRNVAGADKVFIQR